MLAKKRRYLLCHFVDEVVRLAQFSTCERDKACAMVLTPDIAQVKAFGFNGNYAGGPNSCDFPEVEGGCGCVHAEMNCLLKLHGHHSKELIMVMTTSCLLYTSPSPRDVEESRMPSSA